MRIMRLLIPLLIGSVVGMMASDRPSERLTLRGIKTIEVLVEDVTPDEIKAGLTTNQDELSDQIRTDVERRLRKAGVAVGSSFAYLHIRTLSMKADGSNEGL